MLRRVLKKLGLALILLPEPFTTPLGVVLLSTAYVFSRFDRVDSARQLRGLMNLYFGHARPVGQTGKIIHHSLQQRWAGYVWAEPPRSVEVVPKTVIHKIDDSRLALRYCDKIIYHNIKGTLSGYVLPSKSLVPEKIVRRTISKAKCPAPVMAR